MGWKKLLKPTKEGLKLFAALACIDFIYIMYIMYIHFGCYGCSYGFFDYFIWAFMLIINIETLPFLYITPPIIAIILSITVFLLFWYVVSCCAVWLHERFKKKPKILAGILFSVILLIAVSSFFTAYSQFQEYLEGFPPNIQIIDSYCVGGTEGIILVRNVGIQTIRTNEVTVINKTSGSTPMEGPQWTDLKSGNIINQIEPGNVAKYNISCSGLCLFRILVGGRAMTAAVQC